MLKILNEEEVYVNLEEQIDEYFKQNTRLELEIEKIDRSNYIDLQYLLLFFLSPQNQNYSYKLDLLSSLSGKDKDAIKIKNQDWAMISAYLACFKEPIFHNQPIFGSIENNDYGYVYPYIQNIESLNFGRIVPLIPIDIQIFRFLSMSVSEAFSFVIEEEPEKKFKIKTDFLKSNSNEINAAVEKLIDTGSEDQKLNRNAITIIYRACLDYLFSYEKKPTSSAFNNLQNKRTERYSSTGFFTKIENMTVLGFLIYCAQNRTNLLEGLDEIRSKAKEMGGNAKYDEETLSFVLPFPNEEIEDQIIINALDMSDGLLQLIENTVFHASVGEAKFGRGLLSIRIFKKDQRSFNEYLVKQYNEYFMGHDNRNKSVEILDCNTHEVIGTEERSSLDHYKSTTEKGLNNLSDCEIEEHLKNKREIKKRSEERRNVDYYLEVKVIDHSGKNMCDVFADNHKADAEFPFEDKDIRVSTFFSPSQEEREKWKKYNKNDANVIHHYGLQLFDALIQSIDGCFIVKSRADEEPILDKNIYSTSGDGIIDGGGKRFFAGTQYSILLPFVKREKKEYSFINTNFIYPLPLLKYSVINIADIYESKFYEKLTKYGKVLNVSQDEKNRNINLLFNELKPLKPNRNEVLVFNAMQLNIRNTEIFSKALMQYISVENKNNLNIAITHCEGELLKYLVRIFAIFYDRTGENALMKNVQIFLSSYKNKRDEFLLAGSNLKNSLVAQIKLDAARGITKENERGMITFLLDMLERRPGEGSDVDAISYVPFDLLVKYNGKSIFEYNVIDVLEENVQLKDPGCKISPNHMRIGSKIHVDSFYEAVVLFSNNYYTGRFAWLIKENILSEQNLHINERKSPYLFVGYESYSEMLLRDLSRLFAKSCYCVFEYGRQNESGSYGNNVFRHIESIDRSKKYQIVYIVPISSTLSTFSKLEAEFQKEFQETSMIDSYKKAFFVSIIQTRNGDSDVTKGIEEDFFGEISIKEKYIESRLLPRFNSKNNQFQKVFYLFCVQSNWSSPILCKQCYPIHMLSERPLIVTDKTSVIPSQLYGLKDRHFSSGGFNSYDGTSGSVNDLYEFLKPLHTYRGSNHYQYYIETERYLNFLSSTNSETEKPEINKWLYKVKEKIVFPREVHYDIIVCPDHYSNSGFVKLVNSTIFGGASLIINIDVSKEFRDNFKAKHSDISNLYINLCKQNCKSEINFHFVDDTIIRGNSISRTRTLIHSLFPKEAYDPNALARINIFKTVILLINRNSADSIMNYVTEHQDFHSFLNLSVSTLRTHNNACVLCHEANENRRLSYRSSLLELSDRFIKKHIDKSKREVNQVRFHDNEHGYAKQNDTDSEKERQFYYGSKTKVRGFLRLVCTHRLNTNYSNLGAHKNNKLDVFNVLVSTMLDHLKDVLFNDEQQNVNNMDPLSLAISYIVVSSSPFISFRKSSREAVFDLIIILFEIVLSNNFESTHIKKLIDEIEKTDELTHVEKEIKLKILNNRDLEVLINLLKTIVVNTKDNIHLYKILIKQSTALKSTYILRKDNIIKMVYFGFRITHAEERAEFMNYYIYNLKKLIASSTDTAKAMFVEYIILFGVEYMQGELLPEDYCKNHETLGEKLIEYSIWYIQNESGFHLDEKELSTFRDFLKQILIRLYLENTQIIFDGSKNLSRLDAISDSGEKYFLKNYLDLMSWNGISDDSDEKILSEFSIKLGEIYKSLWEEPRDVLKYFNKLATKISIMLSQTCNLNEDEMIRIGFIYKREDQSLELKNNIVKTDETHRTVKDYFGRSDIDLDSDINRSGTTANIENSSIYDILNLDELLDKYNHTDDTNYNGNVNFEKVLIRIGEEYPDETSSIINRNYYYISLEFPKNISEFKMLRSIRIILTFRNRLLQQIRRCGKNNLLLKALGDINTRAQFLKARSSYHNEEDEYDSLLYTQRMYCSPAENRQKHKYDYGDMQSLFISLVNTTIGRLNVKLLAGDTDFQIKRQKITLENLSESLASVVFLPRARDVAFYDRENNLILGNDILKDLTQAEHAKSIFSMYFKKQMSNRVILENEGNTPALLYVLGCFSELINSAARYGKSDHESASEGKIRINVYISDEGYLFVKNEVADVAKTKSSIEKGIKRQTTGISLATICEYFDVLYKNSSDKGVVILFNEGFVEIGMPIFKEV